MTIFSRKPIMGLLAFSILLLAATCREPKQAAPLNLFDLQTRQSIAGVQAVDALKSARLVLVGEHHTDPSHHEAQLQVIRALYAQPVPVLFRNCRAKDRSLLPSELPPASRSNSVRPQHQS